MLWLSFKLRGGQTNCSTSGGGRLIWKLKEEAQQNSSRHQLLRQARQQWHNLPITALFWCAWQYFGWFDSDWNVASRSEYFNEGMWHSFSSQRSRGHWAFAVLALSRGHCQTTWRVFNHALKHVIAYKIVLVVWSATLLFFFWITHRSHLLIFWQHHYSYQCTLGPHTGGAQDILHTVGCVWRHPGWADDLRRVLEKQTHLEIKDSGLQL